MSDLISTTIIIEADALDAANAVFHVLDPDTGGALTFGRHAYSGDKTAQRYITHYGTQTMINQDELLLLRKATVDEFFAYLEALANERGRETPKREQVAAFLAGLSVRPEADLNGTAEAEGVQKVAETAVRPDGQRPVDPVKLPREPVAIGEIKVSETELRVGR